MEVYEENGIELTGLASNSPAVIVHAHWNRTSMVVLEIAVRKLTVLASDLQAAIANATNSNSR